MLALLLSTDSTFDFTRLGKKVEQKLISYSTDNYYRINENIIKMLFTLFLFTLLLCACPNVVANIAVGMRMSS